MFNTPAHPGPFDPLQDADPDVPFFPLMGTDPLAPDLVLEWADKTRKHARSLDDEAEVRRLCAKALDAEHIAWAMQRYLKTGSAEDVRARPTRATYSGATGDDDHDRKELIAYATASLREAAYFACEARDTLLKVELLPVEDAEALATAMAAINRIADLHTPKRQLPIEEPKLPLPAADAGPDRATEETN